VGDLTASLAMTSGSWNTTPDSQSLKWGIDGGEVGGDIGPGNVANPTHSWYAPYAGQHAVSGANFAVGSGGGGSAPSAPTGLSATASSAQVSLGWTVSSGATSYRVFRSTTSGSGYTQIGTPTPTTSYTDSGLINGTTYYYVVKASNSNGDSAYSSQVSATPVSGGGTSVVYDNAASSGFLFGATSASVPITVGTGTNRAALIMVAMVSNNPNANSFVVTLGGVSGVLVTGTDSGATATARTLIYSVVNPPSGAQTANVSWTNSATVNVGVITVSGADQSTPVNGGVFQATSSAASNSGVVTVTSNAGDLTASVAVASDGWVTPYTNRSIKWGADVNSNPITAGGDIGPGTGTTTHTWTDQFIGTVHALSGANFKHAP